MDTNKTTHLTKPFKVVVFDTESDGLPSSGRDDYGRFARVACTCACALDFEFTEADQQFKSCQLDAEMVARAARTTCWRDVSEPDEGAFEPLLRLFDAADVIVGYNSLAFDFPLLLKHYYDETRRGTVRPGLRRYEQHRCKSLDVFARIRDATGMMPRMSRLLTANRFPHGKSGCGADAVTLWHANKRDELEAYCQTDVVRTAELALRPHLDVDISLSDASLVCTVPGHVYGLRAWLHGVGGEGREDVERTM